MLRLRILRLVLEANARAAVRRASLVVLVAILMSSVAVSGMTRGAAIPIEIDMGNSRSMKGRVQEGLRQVVRSMTHGGRFPVPEGAGSHWQVAPPGRPAREFTLVTDQVRREYFESLPYGSMIHEAAEKYEVDPILVAAVIDCESGFRSDAISLKGALGLMQLMPETGEWMGAGNLHDPAQNVDAGVRYLKYLEGRFRGDLSVQLAAYNAGEGVVLRYGGIPPYRETRDFVERVITRYVETKREIARIERFGVGTGRLRGVALSP